MSMDGSNYIIFIPTSFKVEDHITELKKTFEYYYEGDEKDRQKVFNETIKIFKKFHTEIPILEVENFDGKEWIFYTIEEFCHDNFRGEWFGKTRSYIRQMYNISAHKEMLNYIKNSPNNDGLEQHETIYEKESPILKIKMKIIKSKAKGFSGEIYMDTFSPVLFECEDMDSFESCATVLENYYFELIENEYKELLKRSDNHGNDMG